MAQTHRSIASQTDVHVTGLSASLILSYEQKISFLEEKLSRNETKLENYEGNDAKTCFFTGLTSFVIMKELFQTLEPDLPETKLTRQHPFTKFQIFFMVLYRMRLNLTFRYLAYKFEVSPHTISKYFYEGLFVMYSRMRSLVYLPSREDIKKTMPLSFKERFGDTITIIIDCFEVFIERSMLPKALAQTFSFYKHHNTLKFLIGITPQGMISFISEAYGGRSSDKFVTENCGFLQCLEVGDVVMADRGFLIEDALKHLGVRAEIPAFTKGQNQLHPSTDEKRDEKNNCSTSTSTFSSSGLRQANFSAGVTGTNLSENGALIAISTHGRPTLIRDNKSSICSSVSAGRGSINSGVG